MAAATVISVNHHELRNSEHHRAAAPHTSRSSSNLQITTVVATAKHHRCNRTRTSETFSAVHPSRSSHGCTSFEATTMQRTSLHPHSRPPSARTSAVPQLPDSRSHVGAVVIAVNRHCHLHLHCICRNPNFGERKCTATCQHLIRQSNWSTGQLWSTGQSQQSTLVKTANMVK